MRTLSILNLLLTIIVGVAYFGFDKKIFSYGALIILLAASEFFEVINDSKTGE